MQFTTLTFALLAATALAAPASTGQDPGTSSDLNVTSFVDTACGAAMTDADGAPIQGNPVVHTWANMVYAANSVGHDINAVFNSVLLSRPLRPDEQIDINTLGKDSGLRFFVDGPVQCGHNVARLRFQEGMGLCQAVAVGGECARLVQW